MVTYWSHKKRLYQNLESVNTPLTHLPLNSDIFDAIVCYGPNDLSVCVSCHSWQEAFNSFPAYKWGIIMIYRWYKNVSENIQQFENSEICCPCLKSA